MPTFHATAATSYVAIGTAASEVAYANITESADFERMVTMLETTTLADASKKRISGLKDSTFKLSVKGDQTAMAALHTILGTDGKSAVIGPMGNGTGAPKYSVGGTVSKITEKLPVAGLWTADIEFTTSGDVTVGVF